MTITVHDHVLAAGPLDAGTIVTEGKTRYRVERHGCPTEDSRLPATSCPNGSDRFALTVLRLDKHGRPRFGLTECLDSRAVELELPEWSYEYDQDHADTEREDAIVVALLDDDGEVIDTIGGVTGGITVSDHGNVHLDAHTEAYALHLALGMAAARTMEAAR
jgi:hypothetical protein